MAAGLSLNRFAESDASVEANLERAAAITSARYILRRPMPETDLRRAVDSFDAAAQIDPSLWSPRVNAHWLAGKLGRVGEAPVTHLSSPFAAAYFAQVSNRAGRPAAALEWISGAEAATDSHTRTELALASMEAHALRHESEQILSDYRTRLKTCDGERDRNHVIMHLAHAASALPAAVAAGLDARGLEAGLRGLVRSAPAEVGHLITLITFLTSHERWDPALEALVDLGEPYLVDASFRDFFVHCAWRILETGDSARPN